MSPKLKPLLRCSQVLKLFLQVMCKLFSLLTRARVFCSNLSQSERKCWHFRLRLRIGFLAGCSALEKHCFQLLRSGLLHGRQDV
jgi:hypothetical protein